MRLTRNLVVVLGDQLNLRSSAFDGFDPAQDRVWMAEAAGESSFVHSHKVRIAYFLSAMRHFAEDVRKAKFSLEYRPLDAENNRGELDAELASALGKFKPERMVVVEPGEYRIEEAIKTVAQNSNVALDIRPDRDFYCSRQEFRVWAKQHSHLRMEFFYREMRRKTGVLMEGREPAGGKWNFDAENRKSFGKKGPGLLLPPPKVFAPDKITRDVIALVNRRFPQHPGKLDHFDLPVTSKEARLALDDFISNRLPAFGDYQDAMWTGEPYLYHSRLSATMNLKLLDPRVAVIAAEDAYQRGRASLPSVEGFIRQIIGWREYVRGVYWTFMPEYLNRNALDAQEKLPDFIGMARPT